MPTKKLVRSLVITLAAIALPVLTQAPAQAIVGGRAATYGPWAVRVYEDGVPTCTGSVIAPRWVITAAHCVRFDNTDIRFRVGNLDQRRGKEVRRVPGRTFLTPLADVALVQIPRVRVRPVPLPARSAGPLPTGSRLTVQGWGATCEPDESSCQSNRLRQAEVRVIDPADDRCYLLAGTNDYCAEEKAGLPVGGDSGAPALTRTCGRETLAGVFTASDRDSVVAIADATKLRAWITQTISARR